MEQCARKVREEWGLGKDCIANVQDMLEANGIKIIYFINGNFAKHFDRIEQENGKMKVYVKGLQGFFEKPLLHFTVDYANLLAVIEREFFLHIRNSQEEDAQVIFTR